MGVRDISVRLYSLEYPPAPEGVDPVYQTQQPAATNTWYRYVVSGEGTIDGVAYSPGLFTLEAGPARTVTYTVSNGPLKFFDILPDMYTQVDSVDYITSSLEGSIDAAHDTMVVFDAAVIKLDDVVVEVSPAVVAQAGAHLEVDLVQPQSAVILKVAVPVGE